MVWGMTSGAIKMLYARERRDERGTRKKNLRKKKERERGDPMNSGTAVLYQILRRCCAKYLSINKHVSQIHAVL